MENVTLLASSNKSWLCILAKAKQIYWQFLFPCAKISTAMVCIAVLPQLNQKQPGYTKPYITDVDACLNTSDWNQQKAAEFP